MKKPTRASTTKVGKQPLPPKKEPASPADPPEDLAGLIPLTPPRLPGDKPVFPKVGDVSGDDVQHWLKEAFQKNAHPYICERSRNLYLASALEKGITWLVARAASVGAEAEDAQARLMSLARFLGGWMISGYRAGWPGAEKLARKWADIPGFISRDPNVNETSQAMLRRMDQGKEVPALLGKPGKKRLRDTSAPAHRLVSCLHDYANSYRTHIFRDDARLSKDPLVRDLCDLPPFSSKTWQLWHKVTWKVLKHYGKGDPVKHPAFKRDPLRSMLKMKSPLVQQVHEAWQTLARKSVSENP